MVFKYGEDELSNPVTERLNVLDVRDKMVGDVSDLGR